MTVLRILTVFLMTVLGWKVGAASFSAPVTGAGLGLFVSMAVVFDEAFYSNRKNTLSLITVFVGFGIALLFTFGTDHLLLTPLAQESRYFARAAVLLMTCYVLTCALGKTDLFKYGGAFNGAARDEAEAAHEIVVDSSALIDGRIVDIIETEIMDNPLLIPTFVLSELQNLADSKDKFKRARGRRGLEMVQKMKAATTVTVSVLDIDSEAKMGVDDKLLRVSKERSAKLLTTDFNLNQVARAQGVPVININDLAKALRPPAIPGDTLSILLSKSGEEPGQAVGYMADGTMVVCEQAASQIGETTEITISSVLQTSAGRMIFGRLKE